MKRNKNDKLKPKHTYASNQEFMQIDTLSYILSSEAGTVVTVVHRKKEKLSPL